ncbi:MAG: dephospho-CoA kinase [Clostridia bacterium]|nr:dephospho-CoA kinase [Clostridia bacterium]
MSYILGLTGGISTGKSHLSDTLRGKGVPVVDADRISHAVTALGGAAIPRIREAFGADYVRDGELDRKALGALVFNNPEALAKLNALTHPLIFDGMQAQIAEAEKSGAPVVVLDVPLLFETGFDRLCDEVWCAWIPKKLQLERLMARDALTRAEAESRIGSQMSAWEKRRRSDRYIDTRGTKDESAAKVSAMYEELLERIDRERNDAQNG